MRSGFRRICILGTAILLVSVIPNMTRAGDFKEAKQKVPEGVETIFHRVWSPRAFPLKLHLHEDGVVNNNATANINGPGQDTPRRIGNEEVKEALRAGFQTWADVQTAKISFEVAEETTRTSKAACDFENIVTWSDDRSFDGPDDRRVARGITSFYAGPEITLNDTNRMNVPCSAGESRAGEIEYVNLPHDTYPNGTRLKTGTILDMDLVWNSRVFDFVTMSNTEPRRDVLDIQSLATHEFGHLLGLTHTSMKFGGVDGDPFGKHTPTMTLNPIEPRNLTRNPSLQRNMRSLAPDDIAAAGRAYPGPGFFPGDDDNAPFTTGAISGKVTMNGNGLEGVRLWLYDANNGRGDFIPKFESFTATTDDFEAQAGDYKFEGIPPGRYFLCVQQWRNNYPDWGKAEPSEQGYNWSVARQSESTTHFKTECFDDIQTGGNGPPEISAHAYRMRAVMVESGETTMHVNVSVEPH